MFQKFYFIVSGNNVESSFRCSVIWKTFPCSMTGNAECSAIDSRQSYKWYVQNVLSWATRVQSVNVHSDLESVY